MSREPLLTVCKRCGDGLTLDYPIHENEYTEVSWTAYPLPDRDDDPAGWFKPHAILCTECQELFFEFLGVDGDDGPGYE